MFKKLSKMIEPIQADYADIRYEIKTECDIAYDGKELTHIGTNTTDGFVIRILKNGGMATATFTHEKDCQKAIQNALENAELMSLKIKKPLRLAAIEIHKESFIPALDIDPRTISIDEKLALLNEYNKIPHQYPEIIMTNFNYHEMIREKYFVSSQGSEIREDLVTLSIGGIIISKEGNIIQNVRASSGGSSGYKCMLNLHDFFEKRSKIAIDLLKAKPVSGGSHNCILNQSLAGVFTHEAFGHFSEADIIENLPSMRQRMKKGEPLGNPILNIVDNATLPGQLGFYRYDDEGVKVKKTQLIKDGVLCGRLHSRRTAAEFNEPVSGHCVAEDYRYAPIVRMGTIFIENGHSSFNDLLDQLEDGLYLLDAKGGQTSGENFTFGAQYGYEVKNGKIKQMIRDINLNGNLYSTLKNINGIANDLVFSKRGGCGKGQINIRSCHGGPHILINNLMIGG